MIAKDWCQKYDEIKSTVYGTKKSGYALSSSQLKNIQEGMKKMENMLKTLAASPMEYDISQSEIARRQLLMDNLRKQLPLVQSEEDGSYIIDVTGGETNPLLTQDVLLKQKREQTIKQQDMMVLEIGDSVDNIKNQALKIGQEASLHNRLLEKLDNRVDDVTGELQSEARRAEKVKEESQMCYAYICIAVEVVLIVLLLILMSSL